ncbi:MAG: glycosyltransferase family 4 protein [Thermodesulfovibrionales bacterium]|nr:glycosyltransferase family 4 protein [Thermodesulfovibrionales bacterium]
MKLIFIKKNFLIYGGAENYMKTLIGRFRGKADIHIMARKWAETPETTFHRINSISLSSFLSMITFNMNVCRAIKKIKADCAISFERTTCQDIYRAGEGCHIEWLRLRRTIEPRWKRYTFLINPLHIALLRLEKKAFSDTKLIIANSNMVKSQIINHYAVPEKKIKVIYNGVDIKRFSPLNAEIYRARVRKELSISEDAEVILFVGSGFERKGLGTLIRAASLIKSEKNLRLLIIGRGNINKFKSVAKKCGIQNSIIFLDAQSEVEKLYAAADIFALPTIYDPFSNATLEAMASGLPVITTRNNGVAELMQDGEEGFVLEDLTDCAALAEKIGKALSSRESMGYKARLTAEKYPIEQAAEEFMKSISGLIPYTKEFISKTT